MNKVITEVETQRLLAFARQHDWGRDAHTNEDGSITAHCEIVALDGTVSIETKTFTRMAALRAWAGY
jgi:hypothetical protein